MYTDYEIKNGTLTVRGIDRIDIERSCACGQSFRWKKDGDGFVAPALGRVVRVCQNDCDISIYPCKKGEEKDWLAYFDLDRDYAAIEKRLSVDEQLSMCIGSASGIRVFAQEPFETLITFIISANNNIGRIAGIVERLCALCGEKAEFDGKEYYLFPKPESIAALEESELVRIGSGYRAPYIKKSAAIIAGGYQLEKLRDMPLDIARKELLKFPGVGPKVADCVLLFSLGHADAFPLDVWMKRAMRLMYFQGAEPGKKAMEDQIAALGPNSGILQQYIFQYARENM